MDAETLARWQFASGGAITSAGACVLAGLLRAADKPPRLLRAADKPPRLLRAADVPALVTGSLQGNHVFDATLRDHLRIVRPNATDDELDQVAARSGLTG